MLLRVPRFLKQLSSLMVMFCLITAGLIYGTRATQPLPMCASIRTYPRPLQVNLASGQITRDRRSYAAYFNYAGYLPSPDGKAFVWIKHPGYGAPDTVLVGTKGKEQLRQIATEDSITGAWSPDGSAFAYVYPSYVDNYAWITILNRTGTGKRTQALPMLVIGEFDVPSFAGWSADGKYVTVMEGTTSVILWADTLQPVSSTIANAPQLYQTSMMPVWSPHGQHFAYIEQSSTSLNLVIATPEQEEQRFPLKADGGYMYPSLMWSPDGRYVTMAQQRGETNDNYDGNIWVYWSFNIFGVDGSSKLDLKGQKSADSEASKPEAWWMDEGATWVFRQQIPKLGVNETDEDIFSYVTAYHAETATSQQLAQHVAGAPLLLADNRWFAAPIWNNGTIDVNLYSIDGKSRQRLVTGAAPSTLPILTWSESNGGTVAAVWMRTSETGEQIATLTWAHADGSNVQTIDDNFNEITDLYWLNGGHLLSFVAGSGELYRMQFVDLETGVTLFKFGGLRREDLTTPSDAWAPIPRLFESPSGRYVTLTVGEMMSAFDLYLIDLATDEMRQIHKEMYSFSVIHWSPDESSFMFSYLNDFPQVTILNTVSADGKMQRQIDVPGDDSSNLAGWIWCQ